MSQAVWRTRSRNCWICIHESAIQCWMDCFSAMREPYVSRVRTRSHIMSKARCAAPTDRLPWYNDATPSFGPLGRA